MNALRIVSLAVLATVVSLASIFGQSIRRNAPILWDKTSQAQGGAGNKQRIVLRVWHERIQHADGNYGWYLNYAADAQDKNFWGTWKPAGKLATITFTLALMHGTSGVTATHNGTVQLNNASSSQGILFDGGSASPGLVPLVTGATVTAARVGGSNGIAVTITH